MKAKDGNSVIHYDISEGVSGQSLDDTALIFEELLMRKLYEESANLKNKIKSPGNKKYEGLSAEQQDEMVKELIN